MSRTRRKSTLNNNYFSGSLSVLHEFDRLVERRNRYYQMQAQYGREIKWLAKIAAKTDEELMAEAKETYKRQLRDGRDGYTCTTVNTGFKKGAAKITRRANKRFCRMVLKDDERWEDTPYPDEHLGDHHIWDWW